MTTLMMTWMLVGAFLITAIFAVVALALGRKRALVGLCALLVVELLVRLGGARLWNWPADPRRVVEAHDVKLIGEMREMQGEVDLLRSRVAILEGNRAAMARTVTETTAKIEAAEKTRAGWAREAAGARSALERALQQATREMSDGAGKPESGGGR
jgi:hypothetical protein